MNAIISPCGFYRYRLERDVLDFGPTIAFIMVNPSSADAAKDDPTIRKLRGFATRLGARKFIVGNKFAFRATDVGELKNAADPVGPENDFHLMRIMQNADRHFVAWGRLAKLSPNLRHRWRHVLDIANTAGCKLECLGTTADGHPRHPLMTAYATEAAPWKLHLDG